MPDRDPLAERVRAVERALVDDADADLAALGDAAALAARVDEVEARLDDLDERVAELEAATQAVRGYVGNVRHVNRSVAERADAALARVERLESELDEGRPRDGYPGQPPSRRTGQPPVVGASGSDADALPERLTEGAAAESTDAEDEEAAESRGLVAALRHWL
jgi:hypothetical protein